MFEAVGERYWPQYFSVLAERLKAGGRAIVQTIMIRDELFDGYSKPQRFHPPLRVSGRHAAVARAL